MWIRPSSVSDAETVSQQGFVAGVCYIQVCVCVCVLVNSPPPLVGPPPASDIGDKSRLKLLEKPGKCGTIRGGCWEMTAQRGFNG